MRLERKMVPRVAAVRRVSNERLKSSIRGGKASYRPALSRDASAQSGEFVAELPFVSKRSVGTDANPQPGFPEEWLGRRMANELIGHQTGVARRSVAQAATPLNDPIPSRSGEGGQKLFHRDSRSCFVRRSRNWRAGS